MPPPWLIISLVVFGASMGTVAYLILLERKVASWAQDRIGPNRVGPRGLLQPIADGLKFFFKEDYQPAGVDRALFTLAPAIMMAVVIVAYAVIPWGGMVQTESGRWAFQTASLNIGVLFVIAVLSLSVYGIVLGGWASNNKYSFLGGLRATAQMVSYEIPLALSLLAVVVLFGTLDLGVIVEKQAHYWLGFIPAWNVFAQPVAFLMFLVCIHAEANRAPFDLSEAEQELVGGYHTEYSSMRFALFFLAEYAGMILTSAVCIALFFGGWHLPWIEWLWPALAGNVDPNHPAVTTSILAAVARSFIFYGKVVAVIFVFMWVRWSLPRFRFDQLIGLAWRGMIPIGLVLVMATAVLVYLWGPNGRPNMRVGGWMALALLAANVASVVAAMIAGQLLPAPPPTNRRMAVDGSRFTRTPLPEGTS